MGERTRFIGVDAHAKTLAVAVAEDVGQPESYARRARPDRGHGHRPRGEVVVKRDLSLDGERETEP
jgi:hypothetical protein